LVKATGRSQPGHSQPPARARSAARRRTREAEGAAEADIPGLEGGDTGRQAVDLLAGGHRPGGGVPGHVAVVTDPVDGGYRALGVVLIGGSEDGGVGGEAQLQEIHAVTEPDEVIPELGRSELARRSRNEARNDTFL
jgi:hypothetical protein